MEFNDQSSRAALRRFHALCEVGKAIAMAADARDELARWLDAAKHRARHAHDEGAGVVDIANAAGVPQEQVREWLEL